VYAFKETSTHDHFYGSKFMEGSTEISKREDANQLASKFITGFEAMVL
jgi:hypothetical protein